MKISIGNITQVSSELLKTLEKEKVETNRDLEMMMDRTIRINKKDHIEFRNLPSNYNTKAYTVSYVRQHSGIPLEFKVNTSLNYSQIILKAQNLMKNYHLFAIDPFDNLVQYKIIKPADLELVKEELKKLNQKLQKKG